MLVLWVLGAFMMASHRPASLMQGCFWAEDGRVWFMDAYQYGPLRQLLRTQGGYLQVLSRLIGDAGLMVPLHLAPRVMSAISILVDATPVLLLLSRRCAGWGSLRVRMLLATLFLCLPNCAEWHANATGTQWVGALLALMIVLSKVPVGRPGRMLDLALLMLFGLTGPFSILLFPVAMAMAWFRRERWRLIYAIWIFCLAAIQTWEIVSSQASRVHLPLGASLSLLSRILAVRIFLGAVAGSVRPLADLSVPWIIPAAITAASLMLIARALWQGPLELKLFVFFAGMLLAAALFSPLVALKGPVWPLVLRGGNSRYYLVPMLAFLLCAGRVAMTATTRWLRIPAMSLFFIFPAGAIQGWLDFHSAPSIFQPGALFLRSATQFEDAPRGTVVTLPADPDESWNVTLTKH